MYAEICKFALISLAFSFYSYAVPAQKDLYFRECKTSDPKFLECFESEVQRNIPELKDGYSKFGIPPLDPLFIKGQSNLKSSGAFTVNLTVTDLKIYGLSSAKVMNFQLDTKGIKGSGSLKFRQPINFVAPYTGFLILNNVPIEGKGVCNITLVDLLVNVFNFEGKIVEKNGSKRIEIVSINLKVTKISKMLMHFTNLYHNSAGFNKDLNEFLNENWQMLFDELKPVIEETILEHMKRILSKSFRKIPADKIFPA